VLPALVLVDSSAGGKFIDSRLNAELLLGYAGPLPCFL